MTTQSYVLLLKRVEALESRLKLTDQRLGELQVLAENLCARVLGLELDIDPPFPHTVPSGAAQEATADSP